MKTTTAGCLAATLITVLTARAEEPEPEIAGLSQAASDFVLAYNERNAEALAELFTENGELTDLLGEETTSGRDAIRTHYEDILADENGPKMAIEVDSVRIVAPRTAIEDGTVHLTPPDEGALPRSFSYTAVLIGSEDGSWRIASSRTLAEVTDAAGNLSDLAGALVGYWTCHMDGSRFDLSMDWDEGGRFLVGETLTTAPDAEPLAGSVRISWDPGKKSVVSWIFDAEGGSQQGIWTQTEDGWSVRSEGCTSDGESMTANQTLTTDGNDRLLWSVTNRIIGGSKEPDSSLRFVRQPPQPAAE